MRRVVESRQGDGRWAGLVGGDDAPARDGAGRGGVKCAGDGVMGEDGREEGVGGGFEVIGGGVEDEVDGCVGGEGE